MIAAMALEQYFVTVRPLFLDGNSGSWTAC